jgi:cell division protein FtsN
MGRTLKILAYAVILFLTYLVITAALKSCKNDSKDVASAQVENTDAESESYDDDTFFEEGSEENSGVDDFFGPEKEEKIDYNEIDKALDKKSNSTEDTYVEPDYTTTTTPSRPSAPITTSSSSAGEYMVIAGSYIINTNAENMVLKLKKMGYSNAEIVVFDQSQYYTVVAGRSSSYDGALSVSGKLKSRGVDSYVHKKK